MATVNTDFLVQAQENATLRNLLQSADMCTADGMPLVWGSKLFGAPLKERVAGSDMVPQLAARAARKNMTLYFMGAAPGVAAQAAELLEAQHPGLRIVGHSCPFWKPGEAFDEVILDDIRTANPDILLVALGNPKQELWIKEYGEQVGVPVMIGVGASLDFIVGTVKRAPEWMQHAGLEWLARLAQEPRRLWKRYAIDIVKFGPSLFRQWLSMGNDETAAPLTIQTNVIGGTAVLNLSGSLTYGSRYLLQQNVRKVGQYDITINLADVTDMDCTTAGTLMQLKQRIQRQGGEFRLVGLRDSLAQKFRTLQLFEYFNLSKQNLALGYQG